MKKALFTLMLFGLVLAPFNFSQAITQNQINSEVQILCTDGTDWFSGSGTIIDPKGIILTNRHVVEGALENTCFIGFLESINKEPNFGTEENPNLAEVKYITSDKSMDAAVLYLDNSSKKIFPYVNIWDSNSSNLKFGEKIEVVGYPGIGGSTITYTSGDFSGFGSTVDDTSNYIKASTPLEHGNSGGAAYSADGSFVGIPTMVLAGELNSLSYILSVNSIKDWLSNVFGIDYQSKTIEQQPNITQPNITLLSDINAPVWNSYAQTKIKFYGNTTKKYVNYFNYNNADADVTASWPEATDANGIDGYYVYFGTDKSANPLIDGIYTKTKNVSKKLNIPGVYYLIIAAKDKTGNTSQYLIGAYYYLVYPDWISNNPMQYLLVTNRPTYFYVYDYSSGKKGNLLKEIKFDSSITQTIKVPSNNIIIEWNGAENKNFITKQNIYFDKGSLSSRCDISTWRKALDLSYTDSSNNQYKEAVTKAASNLKECEQKFKKEVTSNNIIKTGLNINQGYNFNYEYFYTYDQHKNELGGFFNPFIIIPTKIVTLKENKSNNLNGKIFLQVESRGEAWYVNPKDGKRYYMANGDKAYNAMRNFGVGITNGNLEKLKSDKNLAKKSSGKIFLQVEAKGEAYYIDFNGNAHYLKDGAAAYGIMRSLGVGITNDNLNKITDGGL